jgi:SAM-dependent methyltransferase
MSKHWTEKLFIEDSDLFRATIEERFEKTDAEVEGLLELFDEYGVPEGGLVLDLACGIGRISIPLAKNGFNVLGIDISPPYIQRAREYAEEEGVSEKIRFIVGDMREVATLLKDYAEGLDATVNMWTSMGYWDEETDRSILTQSLSLTKPGGVFIIHTVNRDSLVKKFQARDFVYGEDGLILLMERRLDLETSRMINFWSYYKEDGEDLRFLNKMEINHRVYSLHELKKQFQDTGWKYLSSYGGFDLKPLTTDIFSMIVVAQRTNSKVG